MLALVSEHDPILTQQAQPVETFDQSLLDTCNQMEQIRDTHNGIAIAAPQVGVSQRIVVLSFEPHVLINPTIIGSSGKMKFKEGCLSFPGLWLEIERPSKVVAEYQTIDGTKETRTFTGLHAVVVQHEIDHLNSIVFTSKVSSIRLALAEKNRKRK